MVYPPGSGATVRRDAAVFRWAQRRRLPVPKLLAEAREALVVEDLGGQPARQVLAANPREVQGQVLRVLSSFQGQPLTFDLNPPFDEALFTRELAQFLEFSGLGHGTPAVLDFCRGLASELTMHPYRLCHRDFHLDNLLFTEAGVRAVDFQDMRLGPDTYDVASLLRERGGSELFPAGLAAEAARALQWTAGWEARFLQCAAQRGLKALGTFLKLAHQGREGYRPLIPEVACRAWEAVRALDGPRQLLVTLQELGQI